MSKCCIGCGAELSDGAKFCPRCGKKQQPDGTGEDAIRARMRAEQQKRLAGLEQERKETQPAAPKDQQPEESSKWNPTTKAYVSLALGIVTWVLIVSMTWASIFGSIAGTVIGVQALKQKTPKKKTAIVGVALNGIIVALFLLGMLLGFYSAIFS